MEGVGLHGTLALAGNAAQWYTYRRSLPNVSSTGQLRARDRRPLAPGRLCSPTGCPRTCVSDQCRRCHLPPVRGHRMTASGRRHAALSRQGDPRSGTPIAPRDGRWPQPAREIRYVWFCSCTGRIAKTGISGCSGAWADALAVAAAGEGLERFVTESCLADRVGLSENPTGRG